MCEDYSIVWHGIAPDPWVFETSRTPDRRYQIGTSFYTSRHFCPNCGKHLFKANLNGKYSARLDDGTIMPVGRAYYCPDCHLLYAVPNERELEDGQCAKLSDPAHVEGTVISLDGLADGVESLMQIYNRTTAVPKLEDYCVQIDTLCGGQKYSLKQADVRRMESAYNLCRKAEEYFPEIEIYCRGSDVTHWLLKAAKYRSDYDARLKYALASYEYDTAILNAWLKKAGGEPGGVKGAMPDFNIIANLADDETDISYIYLVSGDKTMADMYYEMAEVKRKYMVRMH